MFGEPCAVVLSLHRLYHKSNAVLCNPIHNELNSLQIHVCDLTDTSSLPKKNIITRRHFNWISYNSIHVCYFFMTSMWNALRGRHTRNGWLCRGFCGDKLLPSNFLPLFPVLYRLLMFGARHGNRKTQECGKQTKLMTNKSTHLAALYFVEKSSGQPNHKWEN